MNIRSRVILFFGCLGLINLMPSYSYAQIQSNLEIVDFNISECESDKENEYCLFYPRIVEQQFNHGIYEVEIAVYLSCGMGAYTHAFVDGDTLTLVCSYREGEDLSFCYCEHYLLYQIKGLEDKDYEIHFSRYKGNSGTKLEYLSLDFFTLSMPMGLTEKEYQVQFQKNLENETNLGRRIVEIGNAVLKLEKNDLLTETKYDSLKNEYDITVELFHRVKGASIRLLEPFSMDSLYVVEQKEFQQKKYNEMKNQWEIIRRQFEEKGIEW